MEAGPEEGKTHLACLRHGHAQECALAGGRTRAMAGLREELESLHGGRGAEGAGVAFAVVLVRLLVLLDGVCCGS